MLSACATDTPPEERAALRRELQRCNATGLPPPAELLPPGACPLRRCCCQCRPMNKAENARCKCAEKCLLR